MRLRLQLGPRVRMACTILNVVPLPGVGAIWAGWRNPHTLLRRNGAWQLALVLLGSFPLVVPGLAGLAWAARDAWRIHDAELGPLPPTDAKGRPAGPPG